LARPYLAARGNGVDTVYSLSVRASPGYWKTTLPEPVTRLRFRLPLGSLQRADNITDGAAGCQPERYRIVFARQRRAVLGAEGV